MVNFYVSDGVKRWIYDHNDVLSRLYTSYDQLEYFCLSIAELDYFDLTPTPPVNLLFDLMEGAVNNGFVGEKFQIIFSTSPSAGDSGGSRWATGRDAWCSSG